MAKFYGTVQGGRGEATRLGHRNLKVTARSWEGSIIVNLGIADDGSVFCTIGLASGSKMGADHMLFKGRISELFDDQNNFGK